MAGPLGEMFDHGGVILSLISFPCLFTPDAIGCDALNTTVSDHVALTHLFLILIKYNSSKYFWHRML